MKVEFYCNSGANIHSTRKEVFDTAADLGIEDEEWNEISDDAKDKMVEEWMWERLEYGFKEIK